MAQNDRTTGLVGNAAIKVPVKAATTANITLSGEQTVDGVACVDGDRVLVKNQTDASDNGIYVVDTGTWDRAKDFDGAHDVVSGTLIPVNGGTINSDTVWRISTADPITIDTTNLSFEQALFSDASGLSFLQAGTGAVQRSMQAKGRDTVSVTDFGVVGDGVTDEATQMQVALNAIKEIALTRPATLVFPPGKYLMNSTTYIEGTSGAPLKQITIDGYGAEIVMTDSFVDTTPFGPIGFRYCEHVEVLGLRWQGTYNDAAQAWFTRATAANPGEPADANRCMGLRTRAVKRLVLRDVKMRNVMLGINPTENFEFADVATPQTEYGCSVLLDNVDVRESWQPISTTYGSCSDVEVVNSKFIGGGTVKFTNMLGFARRLVLRDNLFKNLGFIALDQHEAKATGNTFDNVFAGVRIGSGSDNPNAAIDYSLADVLLTKNTWKSSATYNGERPFLTVTIGATASQLAATAVTYDRIRVQDNDMKAWNDASSSAGPIAYGFDGDMTLKDFAFERNVVTLPDANGCFMTFPASAGITAQKFSGKTKINGNTFRQEVASANVPIQICGATLVAGSELEFKDNTVSTDGTNVQVLAHRFARARLDENTFWIGRASSVSLGVFNMLGVPHVDMARNDVVRSHVDDRGNMLVVGIVAVGDQAAMEAAQIRTRDNKMNRGANGVDSDVVYAAGYGLFEDYGSVVYDSKTLWFRGANTNNFETYNLINPWRNNAAPSTNVAVVVRAGYQVNTQLGGTGENKGYRWSGAAWFSTGTLP